MDPQRANGEPSALRIVIRGVVQGVGFRPFVARVAAECGVVGWVLNDTAGVEIHAEAATEALSSFVEQLRNKPPAAAQISRFQVQPVEPIGLIDFQIRTSRALDRPTVRISPDLAICADCLRELSDPADRRFGYPYINCTNCGPRYSIVLRLPYDRGNTTMADWPMCERCRAEYENPADRRYHAQPVACPDCGPMYRLLESVVEIVGETESARGVPPHPRPLSLKGRREDARDAIARAAQLLRNGKILAIKGIGGYHLACDARNAAAVAELRTRKFRKERPFAVMAADLAQAETLVELTDEHRRLLCDVARPIVLAHARVELAGVAPDTSSLGVMLPYAPLHHLLFQHGAPSPLVLTSANRSSEPIAYRDDDALSRLTGIADAFLIGERPIARRVDDSVVAVRRGRPFMIRRGRGSSPGVVCRSGIGAREPAGDSRGNAVLAASLATRVLGAGAGELPILALGSDLKNAIALVVDGEVLVSQHIGDLGDAETDAAFEETTGDLLAMYAIRSEDTTVVHDLHPQFTSTRIALSLPARRRIAVQHHEAHIASVMAEHDLLDEPVVGVAFDGTGFGRDGTIWGGEFFVGSVRGGFERAAWLRPVQMPGGDAAARFPAQAAAAFIADLPNRPDLARLLVEMPKRFWDALKLVEKRVRCFQSSSIGRLFDAVAALVGFVGESTFEGQAAIWLEHQAEKCAAQPAYPFPNLDHRPLVEAVVTDRIRGRDGCEIAAAFHAAIAAAVVEQVRTLAGSHNIRTVAFSGGAFQNELLLNAVCDGLATDARLRVLTNEAVPVNDGGICLGQAALAAVRK